MDDLFSQSIDFCIVYSSESVIEKLRACFVYMFLLWHMETCNDKNNIYDTNSYHCVLKHTLLYHKSSTSCKYNSLVLLSLLLFCKRVEQNIVCFKSEKYFVFTVVLVSSKTIQGPLLLPSILEFTQLSIYIDVRKYMRNVLQVIITFCALMNKTFVTKRISRSTEVRLWLIS